MATDLCPVKQTAPTQTVRSLTIDLYAVREGRFRFTGSWMFPAAYCPRALVCNGRFEEGVAFSDQEAAEVLSKHLTNHRSITKLISVAINGSKDTRGTLTWDAEDLENSIHQEPLLLEWRLA